MPRYMHISIELTDLVPVRVPYPATSTFAVHDASQYRIHSELLPNSPIERERLYRLFNIVSFAVIMRYSNIRFNELQHR
jgi:hypothetical protein